MSNNLIVEREKGLIELERRIAELRAANAAQSVDMSPEIAALEDKYRQLQHEVFGSLTPWEKVHMARHPNRPTTLDYYAQLDRFDELHGDRQFRDDPAIVAGFAMLHGRAVMAIGQQRGRDTKENLYRNFGMPAPEGYRKVRRLARLASRLSLPIVTFVDTKGADPGITSEEHAQSEAIAGCLLEFTSARVPIVAAVIGEGGSGGALALAIADTVLMLEHSTYSVASPEGCAAILWSDATKAEEAAARLKLTAQDLQSFGIVDEIVAEPLGGAHRDAGAVVARVLDKVDAAVKRLATRSPEELLEERYRKYRRLGQWQTTALDPIQPSPSSGA
jgi:acetyl-CoA carboxylase carboxyl transferase subunit alpha